MTEERKALPPVDIVYMGQMPGKGGKLVLLLIPVDRLQMLVEARAPAETIIYAASPFSLKRNPFQKIGGIYSVEAEIDKEGKLQTIVSSTAKWSRQVVECDLIPVWEANDAAYRQNKRAELAHNRAAEHTAFDKLMTELRWQYMRVSPTNRNAFKLAVLNELDKR